MYNKNMKRIFLIFLFLTYSAAVLAEGFSILKVNRVEKQWVIPPDRRSFIGSRGIQKFDYARPIRAEEVGEHYVVAWRYSGDSLVSPLVLKFEYRNVKGLSASEYTYANLKRGTYKWTFKNIGPMFTEEGKIDRWKVSLILDGKVVAEKRSATWHALEGS